MADSDFCCPGLSVLTQQVPLLIDGLRAEARDNDRLYMRLFADSDQRVVVAMKAAEKAMETALAVTKEAASEAKAATEKRFDEVSDKLDALGESLSKQIITATERAGTTTGRSGGIKDSWGYLVGAAGFGAAIVGIVLAFSQ